MATGITFLARISVARFPLKFSFFFLLFFFFLSSFYFLKFHLCRREKREGWSEASAHGENKKRGQQGGGEGGWKTEKSSQSERTEFSIDQRREIEGGQKGWRTPFDIGCPCRSDDNEKCPACPRSRTDDQLLAHPPLALSVSSSHLIRGRGGWAWNTRDMLPHKFK